MTDASNQKQPVLQLKDVYKSWDIGDRKLDVLFDINLDIFCGESLAIMGPSGSGKSTILHILGLLTSIDKGDILFRGKSIRDISVTDTRVRKDFGFVFQDAKLIPELTVIDNVCVPLMHRGVWPAEQKKRAVTLLDRLGLGERTHHFTNQLSGGETMRVAIARAMISEPLVLFADEPTGALDSKTGKHITDLLLEVVTPERALILVTHHQPLADCADRVVYVQDGRLVDQLKPV
ncbi:MAG: ABC transporter ATP-binding protein [bacterium]|nr:ABC transporter ATP-binding protein [bacterium]